MKKECRLEVYTEGRLIDGPGWIQEHNYNYDAALAAAHRIIKEYNSTVYVHIVNARTGKLIERVVG